MLSPAGKRSLVIGMSLLLMNNCKLQAGVFGCVILDQFVDLLTGQEGYYRVS